MKCFKALAVYLLLLIFVPLIGHGFEKHPQPLNTFSGVSDYIKQHNRLPDSFITKKDARKLGWDIIVCRIALLQKKTQENWGGTRQKEISGQLRPAKASAVMYFITGRKNFRRKKGASGMRRTLTTTAASGGKIEFYFPAMV